MKLLLSSVALLFGLTAAKRSAVYYTETGEYTGETVDEVLSDESIETDSELWGRSDDSDDLTECADKLECYQETVSGDEVYCNGYYGCYEATIEASENAYMDGLRGGQEAWISSEGDVYCGGYVGCFMSSIVASDDIICDGLYGCYNSILETSKDTYLLGYRATVASDIFGNATSGSDTLYVYGFYASQYSIIEDFDTIINYGAYGLYFADIFTGNVDEFTLVNYGKTGSYYGQLYCSHKTTCYVYCRDTGCSSFEVRLARRATLYVYYEDEDCDSELEIEDDSTSDDYFMLSDEEADAKFRQRFEQKKKMKDEARKEFKRKYGKSIDDIKDLDHNEMDQLHTKFEEIYRQVEERYGYQNGKKVLSKSARNGRVHIIKGSANFNDGETVVYLGKNNSEISMFGSMGIGMVAAIIVFAIVNAMMNHKQNKSTSSFGQYTYQSI